MSSTGRWSCSGPRATTRRPVSDLTAVLGVHPGSLYRTFGDKHALFLRALERYRQSQARPLAPALLAGGPVLPRIRAALVGFIELAVEEGKPRGCLAANTVGELLPGDNAVAGAVAGVLADVEDGFLQGLRAAARQGRDTRRGGPRGLGGAR